MLWVGAKHLHFKLSVILRFLCANASPLPITLIAVPHLTGKRYIKLDKLIYNLPLIIEHKLQGGVLFEE